MRAGSGFTLVEVLLVFAALAIIALIATPIDQALYGRVTLRVANADAIQTLRRAQALARSGDGDSAWGVSLIPGSVILFRGSSYAARDTAFDEEGDLPSGITVSGNTEIVFAKFSGSPEATGTLTLASSNGETKTITINAITVLGE